MRSKAARTQIENAFALLVAKRDEAIREALLALKHALGSSSLPTAHSYSYRFHGLRYSRRGVWHGRCKCGWTSKPQREAQLVHDEYGVHVTQDLGRKACYTTPVVCGNCSYRGKVKPFVGMGVSHVNCPRCGRSSLKAAKSRMPIHLYWHNQRRPEVMLDELPSEIIDRLLGGRNEQDYYIRCARHYISLARRFCG